MISVSPTLVAYQHYGTSHLDSRSSSTADCDNYLSTSCSIFAPRTASLIGSVGNKDPAIMAKVVNGTIDTQARPSSSSRTSSAASTPSHSPCPTPRPGRHHARSHSQEGDRFAASSTSTAGPGGSGSFTLSPPRRQSHQGSSKFHFTPTAPSVVAAAQSSASSSNAPTSQSQPTTATAVPIPRRAGSSDITSLGNSEDSKNSVPSGATSPASTLSSSMESSPLKQLASLADKDDDDEGRLKKLLEAQAKRRPRLMRLTPAFASLPGRLSPHPPNTAPIIGTSSTNGVAFPTVENKPSNKSNTDSNINGADHYPSGTSQSNSSVDSRRTKGALEPVGMLQLDMSNLPSPSVRDSNAPQSTTDITELRTKSGRIIKPSLKSSSYFVGSGRPDGAPMSAGVYRAKSTPNTPSVPKAVQFDSKLEHVKIFKFKQRPTAISRSGSPEQTETETEEERDMFPFVNYGRRSPPSATTPTLPVARDSPALSRVSGLSETEEQLVLRLPNFPSSARLSVDKDIFLERIFLAEDLRSVKGTVRVRNLHFEKWVAVRFTLDNWVTVNEVSAEYLESLNESQSDRFTFSIKLNELLNWPRGAGQHETKTMHLCLRYRTGASDEFWDNNDGSNYQLDFRKRQLPPTPLPTPDVSGRLSHRSHSVSSGSAASPQARAIGMARRSGVHTGAGYKSSAFVEDLRRELDRLKSDEESMDRPRIQLKRATSGINDGALPVSSNSRSSRASPPVSPGQRSGSPLWSARYDWGDALRNSSSTATRNRQSVYDYFTAKPAPPPNAMLAAQAASAVDGSASANALSAPTAPHFTVSRASPGSGDSSSAATPTINSFGPVHAGMFSPAVGDVFAHHQPINSSVASSPDKLSVPTSAQSSAASTPVEGNSPTVRPGTKFFSYPPQRRGITSPIASELVSPADSDSDTDDGEVGNQSGRDGSPVMRSPVSRRIVTVPKASLRRQSADKEDGLILEQYDTEPNSPPSSTLSPTISLSSADSDSNTTPGLVTPEDSSSHLADDVPTPRLAPRSRWSPPPARGRLQPSSNTSSDNDPARPRSVSDLSELIQKYCWSSDITPGTAPLPQNADQNGNTGSLTGLYHQEVQSPPLSGSVTPTLDI